MAREFSVSRKLVYPIYRKVEARLAGERQGPKGGEVERLPRENARLQQMEARALARAQEITPPDFRQDPGGRLFYCRLRQ